MSFVISALRVNPWRAYRALTSSSDQPDAVAIVHNRFACAGVIGGDDGGTQGTQVRVRRRHGFVDGQALELGFVQDAEAADRERDPSLAFRFGAHEPVGEASPFSPAIDTTPVDSSTIQSGRAHRGLRRDDEHARQAARGQVRNADAVVPELLRRVFFGVERELARERDVFEGPRQGVEPEDATDFVDIAHPLFRG